MADPLQRWLRSLGCPFSNAVRPSRPLDLQRAVNWLEDSVVRALPVGARAPLRRAPFEPAADAYLGALGAPAGLTWEADAVGVVRWVARRGLLLAAGDLGGQVGEVVDPWNGRMLGAVQGAARDRRGKV
jgi:hypothetical protein